LCGFLKHLPSAGSDEYVMNVLRTPLRYPGGKQKLAPFISEILSENDLSGGHYAEPYAGGSGVAIALLLGGRVEHIHLNDSCPRLFAFWHSVLHHTEEFCRRISSASLTVKEWRRQKEIFARPQEFDRLDIGFAMFFLNRCNRSGIASAGVIGGMDQTGPWKIDARFPRGELVRRIQAIAYKKGAITLKNWDAEKFLTKHIPTLPPNTLVYCDPPYFRKADRLYLNFYAPEDHARVAKVVQKLRRPWIVSYDNAQAILALYCERRSFVYGLQYNASRAYKGREVFFFSDKLTLTRTSALPAINQVIARRCSAWTKAIQGR
jgi:DNA adenine methylase